MAKVFVLFMLILFGSSVYSEAIIQRTLDIQHLDKSVNTKNTSGKGNGTHPTGSTNIKADNTLPGPKPPKPKLCVSLGTCGEEGDKRPDDIRIK